MSLRAESFSEQNSVLFKELELPNIGSKLFTVSGDFSKTVDTYRILTSCSIEVTFLLEHLHIRHMLSEYFDNALNKMLN